MTGKLELAFPALPRKRRMLELTKLPLLLTIEHLSYRLGPDVTQFVFREDKVVTGVDIAVVLHDPGMPTLTRIDAYSGGLTHPVGQDAVEGLHIELAYIPAHPFVEDGTKE